MLAQLRVSVAGGGCGYSRLTCGLGPPDGQPPPKAGKFYVSVHRFTRQKVQESSSEWVYNGCLTVSERIQIPWDRIGQEAIDSALDGINDRCDVVSAVMENAQYVIMNAANVIIDATTGGPYDGFREPFLTMTEGAAEMVTGDWFHGEAMKSAAVRKTITLSGARRIQKIGSVHVLQ